jgi:hypothetical protein
MIYLIYLFLEIFDFFNCTKLNIFLDNLALPNASWLAGTTKFFTVVNDSFCTVC